MRRNSTNYATHPGRLSETEDNALRGSELREQIRSQCPSPLAQIHQCEFLDGSSIGNVEIALEFLNDIAILKLDVY